MKLQPQEVRLECLENYMNSSGFRGIARGKKVDHQTRINWAKEVSKSLLNTPISNTIPEITQVHTPKKVSCKKLNLVAHSSK